MIAMDCPSISSESLGNKDRLGGRVWDYMTHRRGVLGMTAMDCPSISLVNKDRRVWDYMYT